MAHHIGDVDDEELGSYLPVVYGKSVTEAQWYCQLLEDHDIPARVDEDYDGPPPTPCGAIPSGVAVLVPESLLEEAGEIIAEVSGMEAFATDDEDEPADEGELGPGFSIDEVDHEEL